MKHRHHDMIVTKAGNMDLVLFNKAGYQKKWVVSHETCLPVFSDCEYFLCLPQYKEVCLHWLNGGEIEINENGWVAPWRNPIFGPKWVHYHLFMAEGSGAFEVRIKPTIEGSEDG